MPNKIIEKDGNTENVLLDVSQTTAVETDVASGKVFTKVNGVSVTGTLEGGEVPTLNAPTISLNGSTLTITPSYANIVGTKYKYISPSIATFNIYSNGTCIGNTSNSTENAVSFDLDLSSLITAEGTYAITVKASKTNYNDSVASNSINYVVSSGYTVTFTAPGCYAGGSNKYLYIKYNNAPMNNNDYDLKYYTEDQPEVYQDGAGDNPAGNINKLYMWGAGISWFLDGVFQEGTHDNTYTNPTEVTITGNCTISFSELSYFD